MQRFAHLLTFFLMINYQTYNAEIFKPKITVMSSGLRKQYIFIDEYIIAYLKDKHNFNVKEEATIYEILSIPEDFFYQEAQEKLDEIIKKVSEYEPLQKEAEIKERVCNLFENIGKLLLAINWAENGYNESTKTEDAENKECQEFSSENIPNNDITEYSEFVPAYAENIEVCRIMNLKLRSQTINIDEEVITFIRYKYAIQLKPQSTAYEILSLPQTAPFKEAKKRCRARLNVMYTNSETLNGKLFDMYSKARDMITEIYLIECLEATDLTD